MTTKIKQPGVYKRKGTNQLFYVNPQNKQMQGFGSWDEYKKRGYDESSIKGEVPESELNQYKWNVKNPIIGKSLNPEQAKQQLGIGSIIGQKAQNITTGNEFDKVIPKNNINTDMSGYLRNLANGNYLANVGERTTIPKVNQIEGKPVIEGGEEKKGTESTITPKGDEVSLWKNDKTGDYTYNKEKNLPDGEWSKTSEIEGNQYEWNKDEIRDLYKSFLGEKYGPEITPDKEDTWDSITKFHNKHGTSPTQLTNWLQNADTQEKAQQQIGEIEGIGDAVDKESKGEKITVGDLIKAGMDEKTAAEFMARYEDKVEPWAQKVKKKESEYWSELKDDLGIDEDVDLEARINKNINEVEQELITAIENRPDLSDQFDDNFRGVSTSADDKYPDKSGLDALQANIAELDESITNAISERDEAVTDINGKVIPQWMVSGEVKQQLQRANNEISTLENQRKAKANEYNRLYDQVVYKTGLESKEFNAQTNALSNLLNIRQQQQTRMNKGLEEYLRTEKAISESKKEDIINQIRYENMPSVVDAMVEYQNLKNRTEPSYETVEGVGIFYQDGQGNVSKVLDLPKEEETGTRQNPQSASDVLTRTNLNTLNNHGVTDKDALDIWKLLNRSNSAFHSAKDSNGVPYDTKEEGFTLWLQSLDISGDTKSQMIGKWETYKNAVGSNILKDLKEGQSRIENLIDEG